MCGVPLPFIIIGERKSIPSTNELLPTLRLCFTIYEYNTCMDFVYCVNMPQFEVTYARFNRTLVHFVVCGRANMSNFCSANCVS